MNKSAFTLIELLVVVLIIGILSAIALPQYEKAVEKSRAAEALILLRAMKNAEDAYYLANGESKVPALDELDIEIPGEEITFSGKKCHKINDYFILGFMGDIGSPHAARVDSSNNVLYWLPYYRTLGNFYCVANSDKYVPVCKSLGGIDAGDICTGQNNGRCFELAF